jgi:asparagine synthase (glutamine-hydrolysing)
MCGIAGFYDIPADATLLGLFCRLMAHRGPDGSGTLHDGPVGLAHTRLSVIDAAGGSQPMASADGRYVIVYNGEVYNYLELRDELRQLGHAFRTDSDTEVVLEAFAEWGDAAFDRFNGMWGLAVYDRDQCRLTLSRDHFGIKPLYFARVGPGLVFSSEIKPIIMSGHVERAPNDRVLYRYLRYRVHDDGRETFFAGVERLMPGEMLTIDGSGCQVRPYTNLRSELSELARLGRPYDDDAQRQYLSELTRSVRQRLQSDVAVGTSLSGGLDSSTVAVLISRLMAADEEAARSVGARQNTFSAIFPGSINDEEKYVDAAAEACGDTLKVHKVTPTADEFKLDIADFVRTQEEPLISSGPYAQYQVMRAAAEHVTVLLDGQGADETMAGYVPYYLVYLRSLKAGRRYLKLASELACSLDVLLRLVRHRLVERLMGRKAVPIGKLLNAEFAQAFPDERLSVEASNLKERLLQDLFENSIPALLRYEDKNTSRFSLEGRVPFLDLDLLRLVFSLDDEAIIKGGWNKRILRDSLSEVLPKMIVKRRNKVGFTTPEQEWFIRLKNYFYDIYLSSQFASRPYFDQDAVVASFEAFIKGRTSSDSMVFWRLANIELWLREFFDEPTAPKAPKPSDFEPNEGKALDIEAGGSAWRRYPIRTELVSDQTDLDGFVADYVQRFFEALPTQGLGHAEATAGKSHLFISEKIVAISQGRSYFIWDIKAGFWARLLSRFVTRTPTGIGLGSPFTMQLAIQEVGLPRILLASAGSVIGKLIGKRGLFYTMAGGDIRAIDGPTEYSVYPANVSAKLPPKDPSLVAARLSERIRSVLPEGYRDRFVGVVVIDANDIGRNVLGTDCPGDPRLYEEVFADNPLGQAHQQTPLSLVFEL